MGFPELLTPPNSSQLLRLIDVKMELSVSGSGDDILLNNLIDQASNLVYDLLGYSAFRATRRERLQGSMRKELALRALPVIRIDAASYQGEAVDISDFIISNKNAGIITRRAPFQSCDNPSEWQIDYLSGWFLAYDNLAIPISVSSVDNSYNSATSAFLRHMHVGDWFYAGGTLNPYTQAANNGNRIVESATTSKIIVTADSALATEAAGTRDMAFRSVPPELERAAMQAVTVWYRAGTQNPVIKSKTVDDVSITYTETASGSQVGQMQNDISRLLTNWAA